MEVAATAGSTMDERKQVLMKVRSCGDAQPAAGLPQFPPAQSLCRGRRLQTRARCGNREALWPIGWPSRPPVRVGPAGGAHSTRGTKKGDAPVQNLRVNLVQREGPCPPGGELRIRGKEGRSRTQVALTAFCRRPMVAVSATSLASGRHGPCKSFHGPHRVAQGNCHKQNQN